MCCWLAPGVAPCPLPATQPQRPARRLLLALQALKSRWHLPYGAVVHPMAQGGGEVPVVNAMGGNIIRCKRCRTYINPFMAWQDGGRCASWLAARGWLRVAGWAWLAGRGLLGVAGWLRYALWQVGCLLQQPIPSMAAKALCKPSAVFVQPAGGSDCYPPL
jgi:hypothetical protein